MAGSTWLTQYQAIRSSTETLIVAIEDVSDLWPAVHEHFQARIPLKKTLLNNKAHNAVVIEKLPVEYVLTTDPRLRSRFPLEQSPFLFRLPFATILLVTCEDVDDYKGILKPRIKMILQNDEREWFIVFVSKTNPNDPTGKQAKRIYSKLEVDFSSKRRERCCKLELGAVSDMGAWEEIETRLSECIRNTLDRRIQSYDEEVRRQNDNRLAPGWSFTNLFIVKESLAFMFELAYLHEDALREYDELEQIYLEIVNISKQKEFGGMDPGDDCAALLEVSRKQVTQFVVDDYFREFDFRQYLFAHQASLLFKLNRPIDVAGRGFFFILSFSKFLLRHEKDLPFCMREVWIITACLSLSKATSERFSPRSVTPDAEKEFYRLQADLNSLARTKLMRLADIIGYGPFLERTPCNSALLSMSPWPKPSVWPSVPSDSAARILAKEQAVQEKSLSLSTRSSHLPLSPTSLLRDANRRRASLSIGSVSEFLDSRPSFKESGPTEPPSSPQMNSVQRTFSSNARPASPSASPTSRTSFDRPMKLPEIHAAAESELFKLLTHEGLRTALSSVEGFEDFYIELTRAAADNYHRSRKRHGVVLDGELAAIYHRTSKFDSAVNLFEKLCALYSGERWHALLAEVLPRLADCQKQLNQHAGYLSSCIRLLSLDHGLVPAPQRNALQAEVVRLAHTVPATVDVSALLTFCGQPGPPLEVCEGDPCTLSVTVWSGFAEEISLESLSMTLNATSGPDESAKAIKSVEAPVLKPGKNTILMISQPQRPGSYVLGALTGQIGQVKLRSHSCCTISAFASPENDDYLSTERPLRPVLQVSLPRPLVEINPAVSSGLLIGEPQWLGLVIRPIEYSLKGAILHITALADLSLYGPPLCRLQLDSRPKLEKLRTENGIIPSEDENIFELKNGSVELPDWASNAVSVMWLQVLAKRSQQSGSFDDDSVQSARSLHVKLEFGETRSRIYERSIAVMFTEAFSVSTRMLAKENAGTYLLQVTLVSQINAGVTIIDASLSLQDGFLHMEDNDGKQHPSWLLPITISGNAECALLFIIKSQDYKNTDLPNGDYEKNTRSTLTIRYKISERRNLGARPPIINEGGKEDHELVFTRSFMLQRPVLDSLVAVGMLPVPSSSPRVGQQVILQWRIERLKKGVAIQHADNKVTEEELAYEIKANSEAWMIAGRRKGYISLSTHTGAKVLVSVACVPLVAGHIHPPCLELCLVNPRHISLNPPGPHLLSVFPPAPCYSFCIAK